MTSQYRKQSKQPKPQQANQILDRLKREMDKAGYTALVDYGSGLYQPSVTVSIWPKDERKEATR